MATLENKSIGKKNLKGPKTPQQTPLTPLARTFQKYREKYIASGGKLLSRRELEREIAEIRGSC